MPIYYGSTKIDRISFGGTEIDKVYRDDILVFQHGPKYIFPVIYKEPLESEEVVLDSVSGQNYKIGIIPEDGWYRIATRAGSGTSGYNGGGSTGGCISDAIVFLYKDSKYLIWGASGQNTGYISPSDTALGGRGDHGGYSGESGGGGGAAGGHGQRIHWDAGAGGGGTGCIVGLEHDGQTLTEEWSHGGFELTSVEAMVLAGGGGGGIGDNGEPRTGGAGGGAWGRGGRASYGSGRTSGPGEEFGHGQDSGGGWWAGATAGAWCVRDYSNPRFDYGVGVKSGNSCAVGNTFIYKINRLSFILTLKTKPSKVNYMFIADAPYNLGDKSIEVLNNRYAAYYVSKAGYTPIIDGRFVPYDITENITLEETTFDYSLDLRYTNEEVEDYYDYGLLSETITFDTDLKQIIPTDITNTVDCEYLVTSQADEYEDWNSDEGNEDWNVITGSEDWGNVYHNEPVTETINCGATTEETTDVLSLGNIYNI